MQWSTDVRQMKAALWDQAFIGNAYELSNGVRGRHQEKKRATPGNDTWVEALVQR